MGKAEAGDLIVVFQSGAYGLTASPTAFLSHPAAGRSAGLIPLHSIFHPVDDVAFVPASMPQRSSTRINETIAKRCTRKRENCLERIVRLDGPWRLRY